MVRARASVDDAPVSLACGAAHVFARKLFTNPLEILDLRRLAGQPLLRLCQILGSGDANLKAVILRHCPLTSECCEALGMAGERFSVERLDLRYIL